MPERPENHPTAPRSADSPTPADPPPPADPTLFAGDGPEGGEAGEGGAPPPPPTVSNAEFIAALFRDVQPGATALVCSKAGDPNEGGWLAIEADKVADACPGTSNNYVNVASFHRDADGSIAARKERFAACHFLLLDDVGTKINREKLAGFTPTAVIETSPGNSQWLVALDPPIADAAEATRLHKAIVNAGFCDPGASGATSRWARFPIGINGKAKHRQPDGSPFQCRLLAWNPESRYTPESLLQVLGIATAKQIPGADGNSRPLEASPQRPSHGVLKLPEAENPVLSALKARGLHKATLAPGKHDVTCPWVAEHTDELDHGTAYFEPDDEHPAGGFCCQHSHRDRYHIGELCEFLGLTIADAQNRPTVRIQPGELPAVIDAAEQLLATSGGLFQSGGLIVRVQRNPGTGDAEIVPVTQAGLTRTLAESARWDQYDGRSHDFRAVDPPQRHIRILHEAQAYRHLPHLSGIARQPYFRESDGVLVSQPGYDAGSRLLGVFDGDQFQLPDPTRESAEAALALLTDLLAEFPFASERDRSVALSAILTAAVRPSLPLAPAFHVHAPVMGSGKTFLCELIGAFAGPGPNMKVSYPATSDEATKAMLALLIKNPPVIEFDDMDTDWQPHGAIKRMLTASSISDRILGVSKTATVSTRTLILGSGNNVGPVRDLRRRVMTVHLDPRTATPATRSFRGNPLKAVRADRERYVAAALAIVAAWRAAGSPRTRVPPIATFDGPWADRCRHPLIWLGRPDPGVALIEQIREDPDSEALGNLLVAWHDIFGEAPTTLRKAVGATVEQGLGLGAKLFEAIAEFPVVEHNGINRSKLGWVLRKHLGRIVGGFRLEAAKADGRTAYRVVSVLEPTSEMGDAEPHVAD